MIAKIVLNKNSHATDRLFDYRVSDALKNDICVGMRVNVPFGRNNKPIEGYVYELCHSSEHKNLKEITSFIDNFSYFDSTKVEVMEFMRHRYFCSYISAIKCFVPSGVGTNITRYYSLAAIDEEFIAEVTKHSVTADKIINCLKAYDKISEETLRSEVNKNNISSVLNKLLAKGIVEVSTKETENIKDIVKTFVELAIDHEDAYTLIDTMAVKAKARARALEVICDNPIIELSELLMYASCSKGVVDALVERGYCVYSKVVCNDSAIEAPIEHTNTKIELTSHQKEALSKIIPAINESKKRNFFNSRCNRKR